MAWEGVLTPHWARTVERMSAHRVVLCIQDTTELDFNGREIAGLGPLNDLESRKIAPKLVFAGANYLRYCNLTKMNKMKNLNIKNTGDKATEYVVFTASDDCNLGHYMIADNTFDAKGNPSNKLRHMFAFPHYSVKKDDVIVLWTRKGEKSIGKAHNGTNAQHNFFWNLDEHVWNIGGDTAHLIDIRSSTNKTVGKHPAER